MESPSFIEHKVAGVLWVAQAQLSVAGTRMAHVAVEFDPDEFLVAADFLEEHGLIGAAKALRYLATPQVGQPAGTGHSNRENRLRHFREWRSLYYGRFNQEASE